MSMTIREFVQSMKRFAQLSVQQPGACGAVSSRKATVVSAPGAGITITAIELTPDEKRRLCTGGARIPPTSSPDRFYTRSECDALISAERERVLAEFERWRAMNWCPKSFAALIARLRGTP